jgi:hypothetical protein
VQRRRRELQRQLTLDGARAPGNDPPVRRALALSLLALAACHSSPAVLSLDITAGQETDAFTADPPVTRVDVSVTSLDGTVMLKTSAAPGGTFDLGDVKDDQQISVEVTGYTADGTSVMRGRSLTGLLLGSIQGGALPVFVQRTNQWARPPAGLPASHVGAPAAVLGERYLLVTGGANAGKDTRTDPTRGDSYDLFALGGATSGALPRVPETLVSFGTTVLSIDAGGATYVDLTAGTSTEATLPTGLDSFGDVAGGQVFGASDGRLFVVGATRTTSATRGVLVIGTDGTLSAFPLVTARKGAAAAWIDGAGLVVAGGSEDGAGVEVLGDTATKFVERPFPADPTEGAAAATDGKGGVVLAGGVLMGSAAKTRTIAPGCAMACAATEVAGATPSVGLVNGHAYTVAASRTLLVGDEASGDGMTRVFLIDLGGAATEMPLREARRGATPLPTPLGTLALLGGEKADGTAVTAVEMLFPE